MINAYLYWDPGYGGGIDYITISGATDEQGRFKYQEVCSIGNLKFFVTSGLSANVYAPLLPPFAYGSQLFRQIKPLSIVKNEKSDLDLGDVPVQIYFSAVSIIFLDEAGAPLMTTKDGWNRVRLRIRDKNRKIMSENTLPSDWVKKAARLQSSSIAMQLPVGEWSLELSLDPKKDKWLKPDKSLIIQKSESGMEITLRMSSNTAAK
jgi:hypothetical protein